MAEWYILRRREFITQAMERIKVRRADTWQQLQIRSGGFIGRIMGKKILCQTNDNNNKPANNDDEGNSGSSNRFISKGSGMKNVWEIK